MLQDITQPIDARTSVFDTTQASLVNDNCLVCGVLQSRSFFTVCSSFCDSIALENRIYSTIKFQAPKTEQEPNETDWIFFNLNKIRLELMRVKISKQMYDYEKEDKLKELIQERVKLTELLESI